MIHNHPGNYWAKAYNIAQFLIYKLLSSAKLLLMCVYVLEHVYEYVCVPVGVCVCLYICVCVCACVRNLLKFIFLP